MKVVLFFLLLTGLVTAEVPKIFEGLFEKEIPVKGSIGMVVPPRGIEKFLAKVDAAARKDKEWFLKYSADAKPGVPLPFDEKLGLTKEEYGEYIALWKQREFRAAKEVILMLRESYGGGWTLTASGDADAMSTLRYDPEKDAFLSPNGELKRLEDINADTDSVLGAWTGKEWRFEEATGLGRFKENFAIGKFSDTGFGIVIYRVQELTAEGTMLLDKSIVIRYPLGKAGHLKLPPAGSPQR